MSRRMCKPGAPPGGPHGPLQVLHGLSGGRETWTTVVMSAEGGMPPAAGDGGRVMAGPRHPISCPHSQNDSKVHI